MLHASVRTLKYFGALGICASIAVCLLYVTKPAAQSDNKVQSQVQSEASPIYGVTIPAGYRDWRLIPLNPPAGGGQQKRAPLRHHMLVKGLRTGRRPVPDPPQ